MIDEAGWAKIEAARAKLSAKPEVPEGCVSAEMYAKRFGMSRDGAGRVLRQMTQAGIMEAVKFGRGLVWRLKG